MDYKREAADKLRQYTARQSSLDRTAEELLRLEAEFTRIRSAGVDATPVAGGTNTREDRLVNNIAQRAELRAARQDTERWLRIMDSALAELTEEERLILTRFYIHRGRGAADRLGEELHLERAQVYNRKNAALKRFTLLLYGVTER